MAFSTTVRPTSALSSSSTKNGAGLWLGLPWRYPSCSFSKAGGVYASRSKALRASDSSDAHRVSSRLAGVVVLLRHRVAGNESENPWDRRVLDDLRRCDRRIDRRGIRIDRLAGHSVGHTREVHRRVARPRERRRGGAVHRKLAAAPFGSGGAV